MPKRAIGFGILILTLALSAPVGAVRADFVTPVQTGSTPVGPNGQLLPIPTDWFPGTPALGGTDPFVIQKFDHTKYDQPGGQAVLTSVEIVLSYQFQNTVSFTFVNPATLSVTASGSMHMYYNGTATDVLPPVTFKNPVSDTATIADLFPKVKTFGTQIFSGTTSSPKGGYTDASTLAKFNWDGTGAATISLPVFANAKSDFSSSSGNGFGKSVTAAMASYAVFYHYAIPEPASFVLFGMGGVGLVVACRGRRRLKD